MPLKIDSATLNQTISELYRVKGMNKPTDGLRVQADAAAVLGNDQFVSSARLQSLMNDPNSKIVLNLKDPKHPLETKKLANAIAKNLDRQDGKEDGRISIKANNLFDHVLPGGKVSLPLGHITSELGTGFVVVGPAGQLMPKFWAESQGKTVLSIQDGQDGATLGLAK